MPHRAGRVADDADHLVLLHELGRQRGDRPAATCPPRRVLDRPALDPPLPSRSRSMTGHLVIHVESTPGMLVAIPPTDRLAGCLLARAHPAIAVGLDDNRPCFGRARRLPACSRCCRPCWAAWWCPPAHRSRPVRRSKPRASVGAGACSVTSRSAASVAVSSSSSPHAASTKTGGKQAVPSSERFMCPPRWQSTPQRLPHGDA